MTKKLGGILVAAALTASVMTGAGGNAKAEESFCNPLAMDPILLKAHDELGREVDKAFGAARKLTNERQRQELLFANYSTLIHLNSWQSGATYWSALVVSDFCSS